MPLLCEIGEPEDATISKEPRFSVNDGSCEEDFEWDGLSEQQWHWRRHLP